MPLSLLDLIRRYIIRFVILPAAFATIFGGILGSTLAVWLEQRTEKKLLAANGKNFEQLLVSGDSVGLDRQLRAVASSREWQAAWIIDEQSHVIASYPDSTLTASRMQSSRATHSQDFNSEWGVRVGRLYWKSHYYKTAVPAMAVFLCVMGAIIWLQASLGVFLGRLISRHTHSLKQLASLFSRSRPLNADDLAGMPQETLEAAELLGAVRRFVEIEHRLNAAEIESEKQRLRATIAAQVAHDIRSPLAALDTAIQGNDAVADERRSLIRQASRRIREIADDLLHNNRDAAAPNKNTGVVELHGLLKPLLDEKRFQFRDTPRVRIDDELGHGGAMHLRVAPVEFKRVISNLLNNAVEALKDAAGTVRVRALPVQDFVHIRIEDDGLGIPADIIAKLGQQGETHGKAGGSGLGLYHARTCAESWNGRLEIASRVGTGTVITLVLPLMKSPPSAILKNPNARRLDAVLIDDDTLCRATWSAAASRHGKTVQGFSTAAEFYAVAASIQPETPIYIDSDLADGVSGVVESHHILALGFRDIYLTTGHEPGKFTGITHLNGVIGKEPPWA